jgi:hypothetical protein
MRRSGNGTVDKQTKIKRSVAFNLGHKEQGEGESEGRLFVGERVPLSDREFEHHGVYVCRDVCNIAIRASGLSWKRDGNVLQVKASLPWHQARLRKGNTDIFPRCLGFEESDIPPFEEPVCLSCKGTGLREKKHGWGSVPCMRCTAWKDLKARNRREEVSNAATIF